MIRPREILPMLDPLVIFGLFQPSFSEVRESILLISSVVAFHFSVTVLNTYQYSMQYLSSPITQSQDDLMAVACTNVRLRGAGLGDDLLLQQAHYG